MFERPVGATKHVKRMKLKLPAVIAAVNIKRIFKYQPKPLKASSTTFFAFNVFE